jgi:hypothetical protein
MSDIERLEKKLDRILYLLGDGRKGDDLQREAKKIINCKLQRKVNSAIHRSDGCAKKG